VRRLPRQEDLGNSNSSNGIREVNQEACCRATGIIPPWRLAEEASRLVPEGASERSGARIPVYVDQRYVLHDGPSLLQWPPEAISMPATLYLYADRVRIVAGRYEVNHPRKFVAHEGSTLAAHRGGHGAALSGKRGKRYLKRQQLLELGRACFPLPHRDRSPPNPGSGSTTSIGCHNILQSHGAEVLRRAMERGLEEQVFWRHLH